MGAVDGLIGQTQPFPGQKGVAQFDLEGAAITLFAVHFGMVERKTVAAGELGLKTGRGFYVYDDKGGRIR